LGCLIILSALDRTGDTIDVVVNIRLHIVLFPRAIIDASSEREVPRSVFPRAVYEPCSDELLRAWPNDIRSAVDGLSVPFDTYIKPMLMVWVVVF
jgi:hypothetical protein